MLIVPNTMPLLKLDLITSRKVNPNKIGEIISEIINKIGEDVQQSKTPEKQKALMQTKRPKKPTMIKNPVMIWNPFAFSVEVIDCILNVLFLHKNNF